MYSAYRVNYQLRAHRRDDFFEFIKQLLLTPFVMHSKGDLESDQSEQLGELYSDVFKSIETFIDDYRTSDQSKTAKLKTLVPSIGTFFTPLPLRDAFRLYDSKFHITSRRFVPVSFNDVRHILNLSQILAFRTTEKLQLVTFDGDQTMYEEGQNITRDSPMVSQIIQLMKSGTHVALVTAAGYKDNPKRYEGRVEGLLQGFRDEKLDATTVARFHVLGGECNFLFETKPDATLAIVPDEKFAIPEMTEWTDEEIKKLLDVAEKSLQRCVERFELKIAVLRKARAVGTIPVDGVPHPNIAREQLDEMALCVRHEIQRANIKIPFCAFNSGTDVWVDIGNKLIGVNVLRKYLNDIPEKATIHFGDQFLSVGNDYMTRRACCTVWVANPSESVDLLSHYLEHEHLSSEQRDGKRKRVKT